MSCVSVCTPLCVLCVSLSEKLIKRFSVDKLDPRFQDRLLVSYDSMVQPCNNCMDSSNFIA